MYERYTDADLKISLYIRLYTNIIYRRFHILTLFTFWDMCTWDMWNVCLQVYGNNMLKISLLFNSLQTSRINNSKMLRIRNAKFAGYCFIWTQSFRQGFKSALVYLQISLKQTNILTAILLIRSGNVTHIIPFSFLQQDCLLMVILT